MPGTIETYTLRSNTRVTDVTGKLYRAAEAFGIKYWVGEGGGGGKGCLLRRIWNVRRTIQSYTLR